MVGDVKRLFGVIGGFCAVAVVWALLYLVSPLHDSNPWENIPEWATWFLWSFWAGCASGVVAVVAWRFDR